MQNYRFQRTEAGRAEVKSRQLGLSRSARNLLLVMDGSRPAAEWLGLVQGASPADLEQLLEHGLVADPAQPVLPEAGPVDAPVAGAAAANGTAQSPMDYAELYGYLTRHAKQYLGLMKGYRVVLDVERCADLAALRDLANRFIQDVQQAHGEVVADQVRRALGIKA